MRLEFVVSNKTPDGVLLEMVHRPIQEQTRFLRFESGELTEHSSVNVGSYRTLVPYSPGNNLLTHRVLLLPSGADDYESIAALVGEVRQFIHRYVDLGDSFETVATHYVLLTWLYDAFNELPYLRVRGDYGCGKSRFLLTVGSICYKPIFASGASTVSPLFRLIDQIGGTLILDEADFWASDERSQIIKILNNGNARGFPVLRNEVTPTKEFNPRAFDIYGPKIIATRHEFEDQALESRCLTEVLGRRALRSDIPINLPKEFEHEAEELRNRLLMYRFQTLSQQSACSIECHDEDSPRIAQFLGSLLSVVEDPVSRAEVLSFVRGVDVGRDVGRLADHRLLSTIARRQEADESLTLSAVADDFKKQWGAEYGAGISPRWVGSRLRKRLGIKPQKSQGIYVIPTEQHPRLEELKKEFRIGGSGDDGDMPGVLGED